MAPPRRTLPELARRAKVRARILDELARLDPDDALQMVFDLLDEVSEIAPGGPDPAPPPDPARSPTARAPARPVAPSPRPTPGPPAETAALPPSRPAGTESWSLEGLAQELDTAKDREGDDPPPPQALIDLFRTPSPENRAAGEAACRILADRAAYLASRTPEELAGEDSAEEERPSSLTALRRAARAASEAARGDLLPLPPDRPTFVLGHEPDPPLPSPTEETCTKAQKSVPAPPGETPAPEAPGRGSAELQPVQILDSAHPGEVSVVHLPPQEASAPPEPASHGTREISLPDDPAPPGETPAKEPVPAPPLPLPPAEAPDTRVALPNALRKLEDPGVSVAVPARKRRPRGATPPNFTNRGGPAGAGRDDLRGASPPVDDSTRGCLGAQSELGEGARLVLHAHPDDDRGEDSRAQPPGGALGGATIFEVTLADASKGKWAFVNRYTGATHHRYGTEAEIRVKAAQDERIWSAKFSQDTGAIAKRWRTDQKAAQAAKEEKGP